MKANILKSAVLAAALCVGVGAYADSPIHVSPEPGQVTELSEFHLTFDGEWSRGSQYNAKFKVTGPEGVTIPKIMSYSLGVEGGYMIYFEDDAIITTPGTYVLTIPAGRFALNTGDIEETIFEYTIVDADPSAYNGPVTIDPREGTYDSIEMWALTFDGEVAVADEEAITLTEINGIDVRIYPQPEDNTLYIVPLTDDYTLTEAGTYELDLPAGCLEIGGKASPHLRYHYTITGQVQKMVYEMIPSPGTYESIDDGFLLAFATEDEVTLSKNSVWLTSPNGDLDVTTAVGSNYIKVTPVDSEGTPIKLTDNGRYTLIFTSGAVHVGEWVNEEPLVFDFTISKSEGISSVASDKISHSVYTLSGVSIDSDKAALPTGIYIIDGKKTIIVRR